MASTPKPPGRPDLVDEYKAAEHIGMSVAYLRADRYRGRVAGATPGPPFYRLGLGRTIRYDRRDLDAWLAARRVDRSVASADDAPPSVLPPPRPARGKRGSKQRQRVRAAAPYFAPRTVGPLQTFD